MRHGTCMLLMTALLLAVTPASGDTVHMKNGIQIDGVIEQETPEKVVLDVDGRRVVLRADEIRTVERNDKTGAFDRQKAIEDAAARDAKLTRITGLDGKQRILVRDIMAGFLSNNDHVRLETRRKLIAMAEEMDIYRFLEHCLPTLLPRYVPDTMTVMAELNPGRAKLAIRDQLTNVDASCRARALQLLGELADANYAEQMARGLLDHDAGVQAAAAMALGQLNIRKATPLLIEGTASPDPRARNACRLALRRMWAGTEGASGLNTSEEWGAFWEAHQSAAPGYWTTARLEPLVEPGSHFEDE